MSDYDLTAGDHEGELFMLGRDGKGQLCERPMTPDRVTAYLSRLSPHHRDSVVARLSRQAPDWRVLGVVPGVLFAGESTRLIPQGIVAPLRQRWDQEHRRGG